MIRYSDRRQRNLLKVIRLLLLAVTIGGESVIHSLVLAAPAPDRPSPLPYPDKLATFTGSGEMIAMNPDGSKYVAHCRSRGGVIIDDFAKDDSWAVVMRDRLPECVAWSKNGLYIACGFRSARRSKPALPDTLFLLDSKGKTIRELVGHQRSVGGFEGVIRIAFSSDSTLLASSGADGTVRLWEVATGKNIHTLNSQGLASLAFSPDSKRLVTIDHQAVQFWDTGSGKLQSSIRLSDLILGKLLRKARLDGMFLECIAYHPTKDLLAVGIKYRLNNRERIKDIAIQIWDVRNIKAAKLIGILRGLKGGIHCIAFHPDGRHLAASDCHGMVYIWDLLSGKKLHSLNQGAHASELSFSANGKRLAVVGFEQSDSTITIWDFNPRKND